MKVQRFSCHYQKFYRKMYKPTVLLLLFSLLVQDVELSFPNKLYPRSVPKHTTFKDDDVGDPLILTPLIEANRTEEAKQLAEVPDDIWISGASIPSYSGYFTVDKNFDSNLFFWYLPARDESPDDAPVLLWLQGGPGATSLYALFQENGPFFLRSSGSLEENPYSWNKDHNVIYIDNPAGTGFSFTNGGYAQNETKVGQDLLQALKQFFLVFPELADNDFFVTGESYAGKYVPAASYAIYKDNQQSDVKINLKGMVIGNGLCDPEHQLVYGDYLYQIGLVDAAGKKQIDDMEQQVIEAIQTQDFHTAFLLFDDLLNGDLNGGNTLFKNITGFNFYFNYLYSSSPSTAEGDVSAFVDQAYVRKAIHVGNLTFNSDQVEENLVDDLMQSVAPWISELLSNIRVLIYNGQLDIIVAYPLTVNFLNHLDFSAADEYKSAVRYKWYDGDDIAGYVKHAGNLTEVLVRDAGHMVPGDQPKRALDLLYWFVYDQQNPSLTL